MFNVLFLFPKTADSQAVDSFIATTVHGMRSQPGQGPVFVSEGALMGPLGRDIPYSRILQTSIDSPENMMSAINSAGAQLSKPVMQELGVMLLLYETREL